MEEVYPDNSMLQIKSGAKGLKIIGFRKACQSFDTHLDKKLVSMPIAVRHSSTLFYPSFPLQSFV
jgi:hypothetical protein